MATSTPHRTAYELGPHDVHRALVALGVTAVVIWLAWSVPVANWVLPSADTIEENAGRLEATEDALGQGWWAIIVVTVALAIGSVLAVGIDYMRGRNWTVTALKKAIAVASTLLAMWAIWTVSVFAAAGVNILG
ncbi:hypothetical protein CH252_34055 [Rhodococcus sp. 06-1477-1B]|uniref:hypothetical protein n=1 Tax=unclassified Rhodococcus (in: high G+C Gram-positive bacteria) TaxID=192944 RepID=UPI000B9B0CA7|nr:MULTISPECIES: hypothetical protein [unclassified Rhodococcus (in: high G+C Gram-positive bacteria)]OZD36503.1 hypothetical protein CH252_34055 [Rhodococcus sp. 06-1477-1B]OZD43388.1 hypothetical protein CH266_24980 [Rhodococcus sp. 06-1474-1B]OZF42638.1 hypothetical protein CH291_25255 [Rhodococcus sp. 14-1411-2a]